MEVIQHTLFKQGIEAIGRFWEKIVVEHGKTSGDVQADGDVGVEIGAQTGVFMSA